MSRPAIVVRMTTFVSISHILSLVIILLCASFTGCSQGVSEKTIREEIAVTDSLFENYLNDPYRDSLGTVDSYFQFHFRTLERWKNWDLPQPTCLLEDAARFFETITGITHNLEHNYVTMYQSPEDAERDYNAWHVWYRDSAAGLTDDSVRKVWELIDSTSSCR